MISVERSLEVEIDEALVDVDYDTSPNVLIGEVLDWLGEHVSPNDWQYQHVPSCNGRKIVAKHVVKFARATDAIYFKLRWVG